MCSLNELTSNTIAALGLAGRALAGRRSSGNSHSNLAHRPGSCKEARGCSTLGGSFKEAKGRSMLSGSCSSGGGSSCGDSSQGGSGQGAGRAVGWRLATVPESASALDAFRWGPRRGCGNAGTCWLRVICMP